MHRITGGPIMWNKVLLAKGYALGQEGSDWAPGLVGMGPFAGNETTVCLLPGDDGQWFTKQVEALDGSWKEYEGQTSESPTG